MAKKKSERNHLETPVDIATDTAHMQMEEIFENILGKPKPPRVTKVGGMPVDDIIEEISNMLPGGQ